MTPREEFVSEIRAAIKRVVELQAGSRTDLHRAHDELVGLWRGWQIYKRERKRLIDLREEFERRDERARKDSGSYDEYHPGLVHAYERAEEEVSDLLKPGPKAYDWKEWKA